MCAKRKKKSFVVHVHRLLSEKERDGKKKKDCLSICSFKRSTNEKLFRSANRKREENNNNNNNHSPPL
jgi:hypothetical protein